MLIYMTVMNVMEMAVMKIVRMILVFDRLVSACRTVLVRMLIVCFTAHV
jgi:hypothetical protein